MNRHDPGLAAVLAFFVPGYGYIYQGRWFASVVFFAIDAVIFAGLYVFGAASGILFFIDGPDAIRTDNINPFTLFALAAILNVIMRYYAAIDSYRGAQAEAKRDEKRVAETIAASVGDAQRLAKKLSG